MKYVFEISEKLVKAVDTRFVRSLYAQINWHQRMIMIRGARGVGKTTMMLQRIKEQFGYDGLALYVSLDLLWFNEHSILELVDSHIKMGGTHIFIDEVHRYPRNWQQEMKNIYDSYPDYHVVFTGSSAIQLDYSLADLSRRVVSYDMYGLSFREYLELERKGRFMPIMLDSLVENAVLYSAELSHAGFKVLHQFRNYIKSGYYPFYRERDDAYFAKIERIVDAVISQDIPMIEPIEYETISKIRRLIVILSEKVPYTLNVQKLSAQLQVTRNQLLKIFDLLDRASVLRQVFDESHSPKGAVKPGKLLFSNANIPLALGMSGDEGTIRETFLASMLSSRHKLSIPQTGDFLVDRKYLFEVGGKGKGYRQIANLPNSYIVADDIEETYDAHRIPLWLFGFLY